MPAKNSIKKYVENGFYHIYNRGVEKRKIFLDDQDYAVFLSYLKTYLLPKDISGLQDTLVSKESSRQEKDKAAKLLKLNNYSDILDLLCFVLMPNHFHLLVKQTRANAIDSFLNALSTRYVTYFNRKYHRVGPLYQGVYKAVLVRSDEQLLHLTRYIHLNPPTGSDYPSSLPVYLGTKKIEWLKPEAILDYFSKTNPNNSYAAFMGKSSNDEVSGIIVESAIDLGDG